MIQTGSGALPLGPSGLSPEYLVKKKHKTAPEVKRQPLCFFLVKILPPEASDLRNRL
jgi:hypothetical protein